MSPADSALRPNSPAPPRGPARRALTILAALLLTTLIGLAYPAFESGPELVRASWQEPLYFFGLLLVPWALWRGTYGQDHRLPHLRIGSTVALSSAPVGLRVWLRDVPGVVRAVAMTLMVLALARPVNSVVPSTSSDEGIDIVLVLDLSGSMRAVVDQLPEDLAALAPREARGTRPTRLDAAKAVIRDFVSRRKTDRIGVVVFGKSAYVLSPPTLDYQLLDHMVSQMDLKLIDASATAIGDALGTAVARLRRSTSKSKAILLLTDGDSNAGSVDPDYATHLATVVGAKVFTVQIGNGDTAEVQDGVDLFGQPRYVTVSSQVNPELLKKIADKTGGQTYVATDAQALRASFHDVLDRLEKTKFESTLATFEDLYRYLLVPGALLIALEILLRALVLRRFP